MNFDVICKSFAPTDSWGVLLWESLKERHNVVKFIYNLLSESRTLHGKKWLECMENDTDTKVMKLFAI